MKCWNHSTSNRMIPFRSATKDGKRYYVTFIDDFSRYGYGYMIKHKSDTFEVFKRYQNKVENQLDIKIKLAPPRTPQLNGVTERRNRTMLDMVRSMMCQATLPIIFWGYALETAAHILNLVPTKKMDVKTTFLNGKLTEDVFMAQPEGFEKVKPDVSFALSMVSRHQQNPGEGHWTAVKNILSSAVALDGTLCLVDQDRVKPIIVNDLSKWETVGFSIQVHN
ncbi:retrotransposon protein, putative, ty1-copia subclass [Tanacetum coccineum]